MVEYEVTSHCAAGEGEYDQIPVCECNRFKRHRRFASVELSKRTGYDRSDDTLNECKEYEARRWYETKAARDIIQTVSFYNDEGGDDDDDDEWKQSCPSPERDTQDKKQRDYDKEIQIEDIPEKEVHTNAKDEERREPCLFSFEYFKRKWRKFRDLVDYCYPALSKKKEYYRCPYPCCPSRVGEPKPKDDQDDEDQPAGNGGIDVDHESGGIPIGPPDPKPSRLEENPKKTVEPPPFAGGSAVPEFGSTFDADDRVPRPDDSAHHAIVKTCCDDDDFWTTFLQILLLAPLLAFTAYLFVQWYKARQEYMEKLGKLNKLKRENENLLGAINRLDAFVMSCQMSPIVCVKRQSKLGDQVRRICQSLKNHKEKIKELEQDRAIYREVLWNLKTCA